MRYIWINPVVDRMISPDMLDEFLADMEYIRVSCRTDWGQVVKDKYRIAVRDAEGTVVDMRCPLAYELVRTLHSAGRVNNIELEEQNRNADKNETGEEHIEARDSQPAGGNWEEGNRIRKNGDRVLGENEAQLIFPDIEPILLHCAREIAGREDLKGNEKLIVTPCRSLAELGNRLNLKETRFLSWNDFLKENGRINDADKCEKHLAVEKSQAESTPIPPGFFKQLEVAQESITGYSQIENYFLSGKWKQVKLTELLYCEGGCHNGDGVIKK